MATVVELKENGLKFLLVGTGFGHYKATERGFFDMLIEDENESPMVCICDSKGALYWTSSNNIKVVSVDGVFIEELSRSLEIDNIGVELKRNSNAPYVSDGADKLEYSDKICNMCKNKALSDEIFCLDHIHLSPNAKKYGR